MNYQKSHTVFKFNPPARTNHRYKWLGDHYVGIKPRDLLGGNELFKITNRGAGGLFV